MFKLFVEVGHWGIVTHVSNKTEIQNRFFCKTTKNLLKEEIDKFLFNTHTSTNNIIYAYHTNTIPVWNRTRDNLLFMCWDQGHEPIDQRNLKPKKIWKKPKKQGMLD